MNRTIYEVANEEPSSSLAGWIRVVIARIAVNNPAWRAAYDQMLNASPTPRHPESVSLRNDTQDAYVPVLLAEFASSPEQAGGILREQAAILTDRPVGPVDVIDLVSGVVAAEIWMTALRADDLSYAAGKGPDAVAAAAAILARVASQGLDAMPFDPDWPKLHYPMGRVLQAAARGRTWAARHLGDSRWPEVCARVVTDLAYHSAGGSKTHEAALLLGVRMIDIPAQD